MTLYRLPLFLAGASCHATCPAGAGCLGPNDPALCGSCDLVGGTFDPCETGPAPSSRSNTGVIVGVVVVVLLVVIVVLVGLGVWVGVVCIRRWKERKKGSFDISVSYDCISGASEVQSGIRVVVYRLAANWLGLEG